MGLNGETSYVIFLYIFLTSNPTRKKELKDRLYIYDNRLSRTIYMCVYTRYAQLGQISLIVYMLAMQKANQTKRTISL